jgi:hypothetical protein
MAKKTKIQQAATLVKLQLGQITHPEKRGKKKNQKKTDSKAKLRDGFGKSNSSMQQEHNTARIE